MVYGLLGEKLSHSFSPQIHRAFFELAGISGEYKLFELEKHQLRAFLKNAPSEGYQGLNVTIPYKTEVIPLLHDISPEAEKIGAVNTITLKGGLTGYNTDYFGIADTFIKNQVAVNGKRVLVAGSGGAAKSVITYLLDAAVGELYIASRNPDPVRDRFTDDWGSPPTGYPSLNRVQSSRFKHMTVVSYEQIKDYRPYDIIINTTPVGMYPKGGASPLTAEQLKGAGFLFDLIYNPAKTRLMELAESLKIPCVNGLYMLAAQAVKAQEIWNGSEYGLDMVDGIYRKMLQVHP